MKEMMLCVILVAAGALAELEAPEPAEKTVAEISPSRLNINYDADDEGPCCQMCYTPWFDRDNPGGYGDYETLVDLKRENPGKICRQPCAIQVQTPAGAEAYTTGQVFRSYDTVVGFACVNAQQRKSKCLDYKVRFACPCLRKKT